MYNGKPKASLSNIIRYTSMLTTKCYPLQASKLKLTKCYAYNTVICVLMYIHTIIPEALYKSAVRVYTYTICSLV